MQTRKIVVIINNRANRVIIIEHNAKAGTYNNYQNNFAIGYIIILYTTR